MGMEMGYYYSPWILTASWPPSEHTGVLSPSSRPLRVGREGVAANCALRTGQGPRRTTLLLPSFKLTQLTSVASRRSFSQGQLSSVSLATLVDAAVRHSGGGEDRGALHRPICAVRTAAPEVGRWSVSGIPAAMTVSTTWGTKICRPRGRQPGRWRQPFPLPWLPEAKLLLVPLKAVTALIDGEPRLPELAIGQVFDRSLTVLLEDRPQSSNAGTDQDTPDQTQFLLEPYGRPIGHRNDRPNICNVSLSPRWGAPVPGPRPPGPRPPPWSRWSRWPSAPGSLPRTRALGHGRLVSTCPSSTQHRAANWKLVPIGAPS